MCFASFLLFSAFFTSQIITTQLMMDNKFDAFVGFAMLGVMNLFYAFGSLYSPRLLTVIGIKKSMVLGAFGHFVFVFALVYPAWRKDEKTMSLILLYTSVVLNGLLQQFLWLAIGEYLTFSSS